MIIPITNQAMDLIFLMEIGQLNTTSISPSPQRTQKNPASPAPRNQLKIRSLPQKNMRKPAGIVGFAEGTVTPCDSQCNNDDLDQNTSKLMFVTPF
jgi:hypothetical protein